ncbi:MAG TPA: hypothetical protein VI306_24455 [Pyrinomonadaceae bacterium]
MIRTRKNYSSLRHDWWSYLLPVFLLLTPLVSTSHADGGVVFCQRTEAPLNVTLFFTETPLRPGPVDLSVLVEKTEGHSPILDARIFIELQHEGGRIIRVEATRNQARNKLLYCNTLNLPLAGQWKMRMHVIHGNNAVEVLSDLVVAPSQSLLLSYWKLTATPAVIIILFIFNQWLRRGPFIR